MADAPDAPTVDDQQAGERIDELARRIAAARVLDPRADVLLDEARTWMDGCMDALGDGDPLVAMESALMGLGVLRAGELLDALSFRE